MVHNVYIGKNIDGQKMKDEAQRNLDKNGEETIIHHHGYADYCELHREVQQHDHYAKPEEVVEDGGEGLREG